MLVFSQAGNKKKMHQNENRQLFFCFTNMLIKHIADSSLLKNTHGISLRELEVPSRRVKIDFELKYVECDLADERLEHHPVVKMYLSAQMHRDRDTGGELNIHLDEHRLEKVYKGTLQGQLKDEYTHLSPMAAIGIRSYVVHSNDTGTPCYVNGGTTHAFLGDIAKQPNSYDHNLDLMMHTVVVTGREPIKKGTIELKVTNFELGSAVQFAPIGATAMGSMNIEERSSRLKSYINQSMEIEGSFPETIKGTERMRAPMDISEAGLEFTGDSFLPVAAFAMQAEVPKSNVDFFWNAYERVMAHANYSPVSDWYDFTPKEKARIAASIVSYAIQTFDYIGDAFYTGVRAGPREAGQKVAGRYASRFAGRFAGQMQGEKVGNEEFQSVGWETLAFDCEDGANGIKCTAAALCDLNLQNYPDKKRAAILGELQSIMQNRYINMMTLSAVHGAKAGDQTEQLGAHMYDAFFPDHQFQAALQRTPQGRELLQRIGASGAPAPTEQISAAPQSGADRLPHLVGEGTGPYDPYGIVNDPLLDARQYIAREMHSAAPFKKLIPHEPGKASPFYLALLSCSSDHVINKYGVNVGSFICVNVNQKTQKLTRGVLFVDAINDRDNVGLVPMPPLPDQDMALIREIIALRPPPRPLVLDKSKPMDGPERDEHMDRLVAFIKSRGRPQGNRKLGGVDLFVRPHAWNADRANMMIRDAMRLDRIYDAEYEKEMITNNIWNWRLRLYVK